jgi:hypothetical protein
MAIRTINPKTVRGGVPAGKLTVRQVAPRHSQSIAVMQVGSASGHRNPRRVGRALPPRGMAG